MDFCGGAAEFLGHRHSGCAIFDGDFAFALLSLLSHWWIPKVWVRPILLTYLLPALTARRRNDFLKYRGTLLGNNEGSSRWHRNMRTSFRDNHFLNFYL